MVSIKIGPSLYGREILCLMHELGSMPEYRLYQELMALTNSIFIFDKNHSELRDYIATLTTDPRSAHLFLPPNREQLHVVSLDIVRLLHNFVAASMSLREHALAMYNRHCKGTDRFPEYKERVKQVFGDDPLAQFVMDLRRYCQHYQSPNLRYLGVVSETDGRLKHSAVLAVEDLLSFDDWNVLARVFIDSCQDVIDILDVVAQYRQKVVEFYKWFQERQSEIHAEEIARFRAKEAQLLSLQIRDKVELCLAHKDDMPYRGEEIFSTVFTRKQYDELNELPTGSSERGKRALELLQQCFSVPDDLAQKILELYQEPGFFLPRSQSSPPDVEKQ